MQLLLFLYAVCCYVYIRFVCVCCDDQNDVIAINISYTKHKTANVISCHRSCFIAIAPNRNLRSHLAAPMSKHEHIYPYTYSFYVNRPYYIYTCVCGFVCDSSDASDCVKCVERRPRRRTANIRMRSMILWRIYVAIFTFLMLENIRTLYVYIVRGHTNTALTYTYDSCDIIAHKLA